MAKAVERPRKTKLTDTFVKSLRPNPAGRYEIKDTVVPGLCIRVSESGAASWALHVRYPGHRGPTRRALGRYPSLSLAEARERAAAWRKMIDKGIDPTEAEERERLAQQQRRENSFARVAQDFIDEKVSRERQSQDCTRDINRFFVPAWGALPITDITDDQVSALIKTKRKTPVRARNLLALAKRMFRWAKEQRVYGVKQSPAADLNARALLGDEIGRVGDHVLSDAELRAFWLAAGNLGYPHGPAYRLLLLTGLRLNEVADAVYTEFHPDLVKLMRRKADGEDIAADLKLLTAEQRIWTIPAARMKGRDFGKRKSRPHTIPLSDNAMALLLELPSFKTGHGDFLFTTTNGDSPVWLGAKIKRKLDEAMLKILRDDDPAAELHPWKTHDLRRTVRTNLSRLRVPDSVAEAILAHVKPGIEAVYNHDDLVGEKREALAAWAIRLQNIFNPQPSNVVSIMHRVAEHAP